MIRNCRPADAEKRTIIVMQTKTLFLAVNLVSNTLNYDQMCLVIVDFLLIVNVFITFATL